MYCNLGRSKAKDATYIIKTFLKPLGINSWANYCAAIGSKALEFAGITYPKATAVAQQFIVKESINAKDVLEKKVTIPAGSIVVWKWIGSWRGHTGFNTRDWTGATGYTIEGNTTDAKGNSGVVALKKRTISLHTSFRITHFTLVDNGL